MLIDAPQALSIVRELAAKGFKAFYAGGCVRDALLGRSHADIDIATDAAPADVTRLFQHTVEVGAQFGVVKVIVEGLEYDVAAFRSDGAYLDGRHPVEVHFSTPEEDARRRDITINGMFYDPLQDEIIDYVNGREDLDRKVIRAIGKADDRIEEDKLRMLRIIRFAGVLGFEIEAATLAAVSRQAAEIGTVSVERIAEELGKMLTSQRPADCMRRLIETGLMAEILPEVMAMDGIAQPEQFHPEGDVLAHTLLMFDLLQQNIPGKFEPSLPLGLGILLHDIAKPITMTETDRIRFHGHCVKGVRLAEQIMRRLRFPNQLIQTVSELVGQHMRFMDVARMRESKLKRFLRQDDFDLHMALHWLDCMSSHKDMTCHDFCIAKLEEFSHEKIELRPALLISGDDLIREGYQPGPAFREMLGFAEDLQLEGRAGNADELLEAVKTHFPLSPAETRKNAK